ncbi:MAG: TlpA family protein disulfide reductase [Clostridia bacterium]|nr:TlpA family protein disulfide reductase [Clostridia bacterium]
MKKIIALVMAIAMLLGISALAEGQGFTTFNTIDMEGNPVTNEVFADYDLTMVNIWATWCGYCIDEMPEFTELKNRLPENANLITICTDAHIETDLTLEILASVNANFQTLILTQDMVDQLVSQVYAFPTTFFLDSEGKVVGEPIVGVPSLENAGDAYYDYMMYLMGEME